MNMKTLRRRQKELTAHTVNSAVLDGIDGRIVEVQARAVELLERPIAWNRAVTVAGMPPRDAADMLTRIAAALAVSGKDRCPMRITVNVHPDGHSAALDLPIALALMQTIGAAPETDPGDWLAFGSLDIHGDCRHTPGALSLTAAARNGQRVILPEANAAQCRLAKAILDVTLYPAANLQTALSILGGAPVAPVTGGRIRVQSVQPDPPDFADVVGQERARRAAEIAAAGGHSLLMSGSPGIGKTLIASAMAGILPPLSTAEKVELTRIWAAAGMIRRDGEAVTRRPFRSVHHTTTAQSLIGGGAQARPGEVTLAHLGVLFLDELAEFKPSVLEALRQPLEDGEVSISRVARKVTLPSRFSLIAAMNPCPCGYYPDCSCTSAAVRRYRSRISGPLMDRFDLKLVLEQPSLTEQASGEPSETIRLRVSEAMRRQQARLGGTGYHCNADVPGQRAMELMPLSGSGRATLEQVAESARVSMRGLHRLVKVSRTIADLAGSEDIEPNHLEEACEYALDS